MRLKCVTDIRKVDGWPEKTYGLTIDKIYEGNLAPIVWNAMQGNVIRVFDIKFIIYNDENEWCAYDKSFFAPAGE